MKLTLPDFQSRKLGEEDSIRFAANKKNNSKKSVSFENLLNSEKDLPSNGKKRIKQGVEFSSWLTIHGEVKNFTNLRRKDAVFNPGMDKAIESFKSKKVAFFNFEKAESFSKLNEKFKFETSKKFEKNKLTKFEQSKLLNSLNEKKDFLNLFEKNIFAKKLSLYNEELIEEILKSESIKEKSIEKISNEKKFQKVSNFNLPETASLRLNESNDYEDLISERLSTLKSEAFLKQEEKTHLDKLSHSADKLLKTKKSDFNLINFDFNRILKFCENNLIQNELINPVLRHIASNISQNYSYSLEHILNSFDSISFKAYESGFAVRMKLFPEELGELEFHIKKEGQTLSLVALVMNDEAKQVMMKDMDNLSSFFYNEGYNIDQIMVEVKNEQNNSNFENFDKLIAESRKIFDDNFSSKEEKISSSTIHLQKIYKSRGIGRIINKSI